MDGQCLTTDSTDSDSSSRMRSRHWGSYPMMLKMVTYLKRISAILVIYTILTTTTHSPPSRWRLVVICIHPLSEQYFPIPQRKLTPNLRDKVKYVVHYRNLKLYLQFGLAATKIHMVLISKQLSWLKPNIEFNTLQRSLAGSGFLKDFFKLMNSVFGKTQENLRKRVQIELITDAGILRKRVVNPITDCLTVVQCNVALTLNRPSCGRFFARVIETAHVRLSLQSYACKIPSSWSVATTVHGFG